MYNSRVEICGINTSELKVMKEKEKIELIKASQAGDKLAREMVIAGNLKLVLSVVQKFSGRGENPDDLFQVGCIGLMKAIDNFNLELPVRFSSYAVPMISGEVRRHLRDDNPIRVSRSIRDTAYKAMGAKEELTIKLKREPEIEEIAKHLNIKKSEVVIALESIVSPMSLFDPVYSGTTDNVFVMDQIRDPEHQSDWLSELSLRECIENLTDREKRILTLRFINGMTQMEVAKEIGISQAQVSRLEKFSIKNIKNNISQN